MELALRNILKAMELERMHRAKGDHSDPTPSVFSPRAETSVTWTGLRDRQRSLRYCLFFESFAMMLEAGVPIVQAIDVVTGFLTTDQHAGWQGVKADVLAAHPMGPGMERMGIFPRFVPVIVDEGLANGSLDIVFFRLAESFARECQIEYRGD